LSLALPANPAFALRGQNVESQKTLAGLEERLGTGSWAMRTAFLLAGLGPIGAIDYLTLPEPAGARPPAQVAPAAVSASSPKEAFADLAKRLGPNRMITPVVWGNPAELLEFPDFFGNMTKTSMKAAFISSQFADLPKEKRQAIVNQAKETRLPVMGFMLGNPDWVLESKYKDVRARINKLFDALLDLDLGKDLRFVIVFDIEPHIRAYRQQTNWNGDLKGYSVVLRDVILPLVSEFSKKASEKHGRPILFEPAVVTFEPHWWVNGHETEDKLKIKNLEHPPGIVIAGMTYQPDAKRTLSVATRVGNRALAVPGDPVLPARNVLFMFGLETKLEAGTPNFFGKEGEIPKVLLDVYNGMPPKMQDRLFGPFIHFGSVGPKSGIRRAQDVFSKWVAPASSSQAGPAAGTFGVENKTLEFTPERIRLKLQIPGNWAGKEKDLVAVLLRQTDTFYVQRKDRATGPFRDIASDGSVTLESDRPLKGEKAGKVAVVVLRRSDVERFITTYNEGRGNGAAKAAGQYGLAIISVTPEGTTRIVEGLRAGLEEILSVDDAVKRIEALAKGDPNLREVRFEFAGSANPAVRSLKGVSYWPSFRGNVWQVASYSNPQGQVKVSISAAEPDTIVVEPVDLGDLTILRPTAPKESPAAGLEEGIQMETVEKLAGRTGVPLKVPEGATRAILIPEARLLRPAEEVPQTILHVYVQDSLSAAAAAILPRAMGTIQMHLLSDDPAVLENKLAQASADRRFAKELSVIVVDAALQGRIRRGELLPEGHALTLLVPSKGWESYTNYQKELAVLLEEPPSRLQNWVLLLSAGSVQKVTIGDQEFTAIFA